MRFSQIIFILIGVLLYSCAQRVPLSGGEKDIIPPAVKSYSQKNGSVNFSEKTIEINFDEFIKLNNLQSQLIVSPLMKQLPEIKAKNKKLIITLPDSLLPNTTYSINFGDAVQDITEGNVFPNFKYVFATGNSLDSLSLSGNVSDALSLIPQAGVLVMLYDQFEDSIPLKEIPRYINKTDKSGNFNIDNVAPGNYKVFALSDINSNYLYDLPNELIAFNDDIISLDSNTYDLQLKLFQENNDIQFIKKSSYTEYGKIELELNLPSENISFQSLDFDSNNLLVERNDVLDKRTIWIKGDSLPEEVTLKILEQNTIIDTVSIRIKNTPKDSTLSLFSNTSASFDLNKPITLTSKTPVTNIDTSKVSLYIDSTKTAFNITPDSIIDRVYHINTAITPKTNYTLFIEPGAFTDIYGNVNDTIIKHFKTKRERDYGTLLVKINIDSNQAFILQLLKKDKVIQEVLGSGMTDFNFNYLSAGDYGLKIILDQNQNGKWDTGNYFEKLQPEKTMYFPGLITITENWDMEQEWIIE